tara:strand:+ start:1336 stop:1920 length:585 start_codon:yes stop_codon:yes gene_type:complete
MLSYEDNTIKLILIIRLSGHIELSEKIIYNKNIIEIEEIRKEYIERDFFNWLTYDLDLRQKLKLNEINQNDLLEYYQKNNENLGLIPGEYRRAKRLCDCFESKWWMTTEKIMGWKQIHNSIRNIHRIRVWRLERDFETDDIDNYNKNDWFEPNYGEKISSLNYMYYCGLNDQPQVHDTDEMEFYLVDKKLFVRI